MLASELPRALVTGGARGIGRAIAEALVAEGVAVVLLDRDGPQAAETARAIAAKGGQCNAVVADVTDGQQLQAAVEEAVAALGGPIDILVNNAGIVVPGHFSETEPADTFAQIDVNLKAPLYLTHLLLPRMLARGRGHIVNIASAAGRAPCPAVAIYTATKFAVVGFSEALRAELAGTGVHVSAICPGLIRTGILDEATVRRLPQKRLELLARLGASPRRVAAATISALKHDRAVVTVTGPAHVFNLWYRHFPRSFRWTLARIGRYQRKEIDQL